jgi:hypothetical protein
VAVCEPEPVGSQAIEIGRANARSAITTDVAEAEIVREDEYDIRRLRCRR